VSCVFSVILSMTVNSLKLQATLCQSCSPPDRGLGLGLGTVGLGLGLGLEVSVLN